MERRGCKMFTFVVYVELVLDFGSSDFVVLVCLVFLMRFSASARAFLRRLLCGYGVGLGWVVY